MRFRVWDKHKKKMYSDEDYNKTWKIIYKPFIGLVACKKENEKVDSLILMQSTKLTDKNEKEIYEGDIVKCEWEDEFRYVYVVGIVKWFMGGFLTENVENRSYWKKTKESMNEWWTTNLLFYHNDIEIIGNIYENPKKNFK